MLNRFVSSNLLLALVSIAYLPTSKIFVQAQGVDTPSNSTENSTNTLDLGQYIPTSCSYSWPEIYGATDEILAQDRYENNTLEYFDQTQQLNSAILFDLGQRPFLTAIIGCSTVFKPAHDLAIQISIQDMKSLNITKVEDFTVFGNVTVGGAEEAKAAGKYCKEIKFDIDDKIVETDVVSSRNEVTQLIFVTEAGKKFEMGSQLPNARIDKAFFNQSNATIAGFRGTLSHGSDGDFLSQLSFVVWSPQCADPHYVAYILGGVALVLLIVVLVCICSCKKKKGENRIVDNELPGTGLYQEEKTRNDNLNDDVQLQDFEDRPEGVSFNIMETPGNKSNSKLKGSGV